MAKAAKSPARPVKTPAKPKKTKGGGARAPGKPKSKADDGDDPLTPDGDIPTKISPKDS